MPPLRDGRGRDVSGLLRVLPALALQHHAGRDAGAGLRLRPRGRARGRRGAGARRARRRDTHPFDCFPVVYPSVYPLAARKPRKTCRFSFDDGDGGALFMC